MRYVLVIHSTTEHISKTTYPNFTEFSLNVAWPWLGPPLMTVLCTSGFADDVVLVIESTAGWRVT